MHIQHVDIAKLLGFERLRIDVDPELQLIAGPNNAGKSSFVKLLETFFSDPSREDMQKLKPLNGYYVDGGSRMLSWIKIRFGGLSKTEAEEFKDLTSRDGSVFVEIRCTRTGKISYRSSGDASRSREAYDRILRSFSFVKIPSVRVSRADETERDQSLARCRRP